MSLKKAGLTALPLCIKEFFQLGSLYAYFEKAKDDNESNKFLPVSSEENILSCIRDALSSVVVKLSKHVDVRYQNTDERSHTATAGIHSFPKHETAANGLTEILQKVKRMESMKLAS